MNLFLTKKKKGLQKADNNNKLCTCVFAPDV